MGTSLGRCDAKSFCFFGGPEAQAVRVKAFVFSPEQGMKLWNLMSSSSWSKEKSHGWEMEKFQVQTAQVRVRTGQKFSLSWSLVDDISEMCFRELFSQSLAPWWGFRTPDVSHFVSLGVASLLPACLGHELLPVCQVWNFGFFHILTCLIFCSLLTYG